MNKWVTEPFLWVRVEAWGAYCFKKQISREFSQTSRVKIIIYSQLGFKFIDTRFTILSWDRPSKLPLQAKWNIKIFRKVSETSPSLKSRDSQLTFTCSNSAIDTVEKDTKHVQS